MDPVTILGAVGSVVGIASFGLQLAKFLDEFIDDFSSADENLNAIFYGVDATNNALIQVEGLLREERKNILERGKPILFSEKALDDVQETADQCLKIFWRIEATVLRKDAKDLELQILRRLTRFHKEIRNTRNLDETPSVLKFDTRQKLSKRQQLTWAFSTGDKLEKYNRQLYRLQTTLILVFQVVHLRYNLTKPKQRLDDMLDLPQSYKKIKSMAAELGMIDGEKSRRYESSSFNPFEPRRGDSRSEAFGRGNGRNRTLSRKRDTLDSLRSEPRESRRPDSRYDDRKERQTPRQTYDEPEIEDRRRRHGSNLNRSFSRATRQDSELSATPETKLVARHLQKAQSYMATHNEGQTELPLGTGPKTENNGFGDFPFSISPTPLEQDEIHSMLPEHGSTPSPEPRISQTPSNSLNPQPKKPTVYQQPSVTDQTLVTEDSENHINQKKSRATDVQFNLDATSRSRQHQPQVSTGAPRPILRRSRPSLDRSQRQDTYETISPPSPLSEESQNNLELFEYQDHSQNQREQRQSRQEAVEDRRSAQLQKQQIEGPSNRPSGASKLPRQSKNGETERYESRTQDHPRQAKRAREGPPKQAFNKSPEMASNNRMPPPKIRLNSEVEEQVMTAPRATREKPASLAAPENTKENLKTEPPAALKSEDESPNIFHVVHPIDRIAGSDSRPISSIKPTSQALESNDSPNDWQTISLNSNASNTTSASKKKTTVYNALKRIARRDFMSQDDLENMFGTGALVTAFVIRGPEYHQIPCAGHFSLRRADMANLRSSGSISWKDFAFLSPEEIYTLSQILETGDEYVKALVQLKSLRKDRGIKFWSSGDRALIAIIYNEKVESENGSVSQLDRRNSVASTERGFALRLRPLLPSNLKWASTAKRMQTETKDIGETDAVTRTSHNYAAYTIRVFDPRNTYGDAKLVPPTFTREGFSEEDILRRILELNVKGPRAIKKKHSLLLSQQEQILQAVAEMMAEEIDSRYSWHVAQLEKLDDSSSGLRSVIVYLRRTMKGAISSIALSKRDPWGIGLEDKKIRSRDSSPGSHDSRPQSPERISRAERETRRERRERLEDERDAEEYMLRRPATTVDIRTRDEDYEYYYRPEWRERREREYSDGYPRRYRSPEPRYVVPVAPTRPERSRSRPPPSSPTGTRYAQNQSSTYGNEPENRRHQTLYQPNAPPRAPTTVMGGPPPPPVIINNRSYNNDDDEDQYYLTAPPHRRSSVSHRAASRVSRPSDYNSRSASIPRRASIPYPEYYDSRSFNPRPREGDNLYEDTDIVRGLLLEWTPAGEETENQDDVSSRSASRKSTEGSEKSSRGKEREINKRQSQAHSRVGRSDTEIMNGIETDKDLQFGTGSKKPDRHSLERGNSERVEGTRVKDGRENKGGSLASDSVVSVDTLNQEPVNRGW